MTLLAIEDITGRRLRGASTHMRDRALSVAAEMREGGIMVEPGKAKLLGTRMLVERGWRTVSDILWTAGQRELAARVRQFVAQMSPARSEKEFLAAALLEGVRERRVKASLSATR